MSILNFISEEFIEFFVTPLYQIDPESNDKNNLRQELLNRVLNERLEKAKEILSKNGINLLKLDIKVKFLNYLVLKCTENNHFPMNAFKRNLHHICQYIIREIKDLPPLLINILNDLSLEYYANHFKVYSIKIYQKKGSMKELIDNTEYILEKYTGMLRSRGASYSGLGIEYHDIHTLEPTIDNEVKVYISFNLNDPQFHDYNNIYVNFWGAGKDLWNEIHSSTINKIASFLAEFLNQPNLLPQNVNISNYFRKTSLPDQIVDIVESSKSMDISLVYDQIIDLNFQFNSDLYNEIRSEINGSYRKKYFTGMYVLIRKLLENLLIDCLRSYYTMQIPEKFWNQDLGRFLTFEVLKKNFNSMKEESDFKQKVGKIPQAYIDILNEFKEEGNIQGHSLFSISHQKIAEENKYILNSLIKKLIEISKRINI